MSRAPKFIPPSRKTASPASQLQVRLQQGLALHQQGQWVQAKALYEQVVKAQPQNFDALHLLGVVEIKTGAARRACELLARAIKLQPDNPSAHYNHGIALTALGMQEEALQSYLRAAALKPDFSEAFYSAGNMLGELGRHQAAVDTYDRALALQPDYLYAWNNRGNALAALAQREAAIDSYQRAIALKPDYADAHNNHGNVLKDLRLYQEALDSYDRAIAVQPAHGDACNNRALVLFELGRYPQALESHDRALALRPDHSEAHFNRGNTLHAMKQYQAAIDSFDRALALLPAYAAAHYNRGIALGTLGRNEEAVAAYDRALAIRPQHPEALNNRGLALRELARLADALDSFERALAIQPEYSEAINNRAVSLNDMRQHQAALADFDRAIALRPDYTDAHNNRGVALSDLGRHTDARESYGQAIALQPDYAEAHWNLGLSELLAGNFERGWQEYEWRWKREQLDPALNRRFTQPLWLGETPLHGKTVLLHAEQGLGDTLQFSRYARQVAEQGARVILEVQKPLARLLAGLPGVHGLVTRGSALPAFDCHCPLLSLPLAFGTNLETMVPPTAGLEKNIDRMAHWASRLGARTVPRIGLVWSGSATHKNDRNRSLSLADILVHLPSGLHYVSLQKEVRDADRQTLASRPDITHFGDELQDFTDTAALCQLVDVVLTVDTSVAHLAATLGRPVWVLLPFHPDWRWMLGRADSPWYPSAKLYRQQAPGGWETVLGQAGQDLARIERTP